MKSLMRLLYSLFRTETGKRIAAWTIIGMMALTVFHPFRHETKKETSHKIKAEATLTDRAWWDALPNTMKQPFALYVFSGEEFDDGNLYGWHYQGCLARYTFEWLNYSACPAHVEMKWLADDVVGKSKYKIVREKNGEFDFKLTLETDPRHGNKPYNYFSREDDDDQSGHSHSPGSLIRLRTNHVQKR